MRPPVAASFISMLLAKGCRHTQPEFRNDRSRAKALDARRVRLADRARGYIAPNPKIPAPHLTRLITLGYVVVTAKGPVVTGDGLIRITESE